MLLYLCSNSVRSGGEKLGDTGSVKAGLGQAKCCSKSCSASSYHHCIKLMIHNWVLSRDLKTVTKKSYCKTSNREQFAYHGSWSFCTFLKPVRYRHPLQGTKWVYRYYGLVNWVIIILNAEPLKRANVTHIIRHFGIFLLSIDGEVKIPRTLNCSKRDLTETKKMYQKWHHGSENIL